MKTLHDGDLHCVTVATPVSLLSRTLFAIAAATSVCFGDFTGGRFDQAAMRGHFRVWIQRGVMTPFPSTVTANHQSCQLLATATLSAEKDNTLMCHTSKRFDFT